MSSADTTVRLDPWWPTNSIQRKLTVADLAALPEELPSGRAFCELYNGRVVQWPIPGCGHGYTQATIGAQFVLQGQERGLGRAYSRVGVVVSRDPDSVYAPDVSFVSKGGLPIRESEEGFLETIPDLVVEIRSRYDSMAELARKALKYLQAGVSTVWIVDESTRTITVEELGTQSRVVRENEPIPPPAAIPDFDLTVGRVFD
jgi:Uma2 family endonuclease